jgi:hypothetical protein
MGGEYGQSMGDSQGKGGGQGRGGKARYICWDLDETLGSFRDYGRMGLTRGIRPLLEGLSRAGIRHVVTTAAWREHAEYVLAAAGIRDFFDAVFAVDDICCNDYNKRYLPVAAHLGIPPAGAPDSILVIGNMAIDAPTDIDLAFIYHPHWSMYDASVLLSLLSQLRSLSGSWAEAHSMLSQSNALPLALGNFEGCERYVDDIRIAVGRVFWKKRAAPSTRIICVLDAPRRYRSEIEIIKTEIKDESAHSACTAPVTVATASLSGASG